MSGIQATSPPPAPPAKPLIPRWAWHRRLYEWMLSFAHSPYSSLALFLFSFCEAIFFPIPPLVLQVPMTLERRDRAWYYATLTTAASVAGGLVGYVIGLQFHELVLRVFEESEINQLERFTGDVWLMTAGAIAVHPFKLYTIAAGMLAVPLWELVVASIVGRGLLFYGSALLLKVFGTPVKVFIEKYFNLLSALLGVLIVALIVAIKLF